MKSQTLGDAHCKCWDANMPLLSSFCSMFCYYNKDSTIKFYLLFKALACCILACMDFWILDHGFFFLGLAFYESWTMCVELMWLDSREIKLRLNLVTNNPMFP